jgi:hypothetical protein
MEELEDLNVREMYAPSGPPVAGAGIAAPIQGMGAPLGSMAVCGSTVASLEGGGFFSMVFKFKVALLMIALPVASFAGTAATLEYVRAPSHSSSLHGDSAASSVAKHSSSDDVSETKYAEGPSGGGSSVPEPSGLAGVAVAFGLLRRRRRGEGRRSKN